MSLNAIRKFTYAATLTMSIWKKSNFIIGSVNLHRPSAPQETAKTSYEKEGQCRGHSIFVQLDLIGESQIKIARL